MKSIRWIPLVAAMACTSVFAQAATPAATRAFALPDHVDTTPAHAAAVQALEQFSARVQPSATSGLRQGRSLARMAPRDAAAMPGFPLAVDDVRALRDARIGWGFAVNDALPADLDAGTPLDAAARPTGQWRYAIMLHGKPVGLVTVVDTGDGWQAVSFGGAGLSAHIDQLVRKHADDPQAQLRYVRVPQASADFIEVRHPGAQAGYVPLQAARSSLHMDTATPRSGAQLLPTLREAARRNRAVSH